MARPTIQCVSVFLYRALRIAVIESGSLHLAIFRFSPLRFLGLISYGLYSLQHAYTVAVPRSSPKYVLL